MPRSFLAWIVLALCACSGVSDDDVEAEGPIEIFAAGDPRSWAAIERSFAIGIESEVGVTSDRGVPRIIHSLACNDGSCSVRALPSSVPGTGRFFVTPKTREIHIHAELTSRRGGMSSIDRVVPAVDGSFAVLHPGAGPGVAFIGGTRIVWYIGLKERHVAWNAERATFTLTPPFALVGEPFAAEGPDDDFFWRVEIGAPLGYPIAKGTLEMATAGTKVSFPLVSVSQSEIAALHVAPVPASLTDQRTASEAPLASISSNRLEVPLSRYRKAWLVFETKTGIFGVAGTRDCLPAANATETFDLLPYDSRFYGLELGIDANSAWSDPPSLNVHGMKEGTAELLLAAGEVTGSAQIDVIRGGL